MRSKQSIYQISFTSGSLFYRDAIKLAEMHADLQNWDLVSQRVIRENTLQSRTSSSLDRLTRELVQRLQTLTPAQLQILIEGTRQEQNQILWLAVCKHYLFVREFAIQVIREKYLRLDWELTYVDFDSFFYAKAEWDQHLEKIKESTRKKLRQVLFLMLSEAEIISSINLIVPAIISPALARAIQTDDRALFMVFPISDADIRNLSL
jgi:hypothetical protein